VCVGEFGFIDKGCGVVEFASMQYIRV